MPPLQSLKEDKIAEKDLKDFKDRGSLCGDPDVDHWTRNARRFEQEAYRFEYSWIVRWS